MSVRKIFMTVPTLQYVTIRKEDTTARRRGFEGNGTTCKRMIEITYIV